MIINFNKTYNLEDFRNCVLCGKEAILYGHQYRCNECKLIIQCDDHIDMIWIGWNDTKIYEEQPFVINIRPYEKRMEIYSFGTVCQMTLSDEIDIKQIYNRLDTYKLLI